MIHATIMLEDDTRLGQVWLRDIPRVGEYLWFQGSLGDAARSKLETSSFLVIDVAHWCSEEWSPNTHTGEPLHSLALYVKPHNARDQGGAG